MNATGMSLKAVFHFEGTISFTQQLSSQLTIQISSKKFKTKVHSHNSFSIVKRKCQYLELPYSSKEDKCKKSENIQSVSVVLTCSQSDTTSSICVIK